MKRSGLIHNFTQGVLVYPVSRIDRYLVLLIGLEVCILSLKSWDVLGMENILHQLAVMYKVQWLVF